MAGFQTHIAVSSAVGVAYAWWGAEVQHLPWGTAAVGGGLCAIAGTMPDLDSDSGVPARETISFAAAIVPMLLFNRLHRSGMSVEQMFLAGVPLYLFIRFGLGTLLKLCTVHRGMFHSLPAIAIAGLGTFLVCDSGLTNDRIFKAVAVSLGYFTHLLLDEFYSVEVRVVGPRLKQSFGTALKLFGNEAGPNFFCYGTLLLLCLAVFQETATVPATAAHPSGPGHSGSPGVPVQPMPVFPPLNSPPNTRENGWRSESPTSRDPRARESISRDPRDQNPRFEDPRDRDERLSFPQENDWRSDNPRARDPRVIPPRSIDPATTPPRSPIPGRVSPQRTDPWQNQRPTAGFRSAFAVDESGVPLEPINPVAGSGTTADSAASDPRGDGSPAERDPVTGKRKIYQARTLRPTEPQRE